MSIVPMHAPVNSRIPIIWAMEFNTIQNTNKTKWRMFWTLNRCLFYVSFYFYHRTHKHSLFVYHLINHLQDKTYFNRPVKALKKPLVDPEREKKNKIRWTWPPKCLFYRGIRWRAPRQQMPSHRITDNQLVHSFEVLGYADKRSG